MYHDVSARLKRNTRHGKGLKVSDLWTFSMETLWSSQVPPFNTAVLHFAAWVLAMDLVRNLTDLHALACIHALSRSWQTSNPASSLNFGLLLVYSSIESSYSFLLVEILALAWISLCSNMFFSCSSGLYKWHLDDVKQLNQGVLRCLVAVDGILLADHAGLSPFTVSVPGATREQQHLGRWHDFCILL